MKKLIFYAALFIIVSSLLAACDKNDDPERVTGGVELYLLESFETVESSCQIDNSTAVLKQDPFIKYSDFLSYNPEEYVFRVSEDAEETIENMEHPVNGVAFGVTADDELVYTGYFWPAHSSLICNWICIDPLSIYQGNELMVQMGYPGMMEGWEIPDKRNDPRILTIFRGDGKLIE